MLLNKQHTTHVAAASTRHLGRGTAPDPRATYSVTLVELELRNRVWVAWASPSTMQIKHKMHRLAYIEVNPILWLDRSVGEGGGACG